MHTVADRVRQMNRVVVVHTERFAAGTEDVVRLQGLVGSGYVLLTKDGRIRRRPLERIRGDEMADAFVRAIPRIVTLLRVDD